MFLMAVDKVSRRHEDIGFGCFHQLQYIFYPCFSDYLPYMDVRKLNDPDTGYSRRNPAAFDGKMLSPDIPCLKISVDADQCCVYGRCQKQGLWADDGSLRFFGKGTYKRYDTVNGVDKGSCSDEQEEESHPEVASG